MIGTRIYGPYIDRGWAIGEIVAVYDHHVEWQVAGEPMTRIMLTRVARENRIGEPTGWVVYDGEWIDREAERELDAERGEALREARAKELRNRVALMRQYVTVTREPGQKYVLTPITV